MKQLLKKAKVIAVFVLAIAYLGCEEVTNIFPDVTSAFTYTINEETGTVTFINVSEEATRYLWDFGDGDSSVEINPVKTYAGTGTYTVTLTAFNVAGASDASQDQVTVVITTEEEEEEEEEEDCTAETSENIDPANGDLNWTFQTDDEAFAFSAFGNTSGGIVSNPVTDGINPSCNVQQFVKTTGCETFAGLGVELATALDFGAITNKVFTMKVLAETQITDVTLRLERLPFPDTEPSQDRVASITEVGVWQELTFDFSDVSSGTFKSMIIYFERNAECDGDVYYFDDITQSEGGTTADCTAETAQSLEATDFNLTFLTDPGTAIIEDGGSYSYIDNPDTDNAVNPSCKVGEIVRDASLPFANNQIEFNSKFDFTANSGFKLKVWAPAVGTNVLLKLEDKTDAGINTEVGAVTTTANAWEELTFNFPGSESGKYDKIVLFFDINTDSGATYYIDDFALDSGGSTGGTNGCSGTLIAATALPVNFEGCETFLSSANFGDGITSELTENPSKTGINTSDFVLQVDKPTGSSFFAGIQNTFASNFDLTTDNVFKIKIYSTKANAIFRFELLADPNDGSIGNPSPVYATVPNANEWTEVEFVFTNLPAAPTAYNQLVIKPDNDQSDSPIDNGATYYFDDLTLNAPSGGGGGAVPPTAGPAAPTQDAADVISIFSDTFTDVPNEGFNNYGS
ncbi:PKD domain-containing protein, partial [Muriicola sp. E247]|uniref:PKD domain-containing protein n=1 Tax=Muriicola sp. E247 TaxID=3242730 RepID=UPI003523F234